ncbi:hypothetical protein CR513_51038, partial [Mucuna pruriens]
MLLLQEFNIEIGDKKGDENSVVDHLSRIERESDSMPIRDDFHQRHPNCTKRDLKVMPSIIYGMILTFGDSTMIKSFAGASQTPRSNWSSNFVMQHMEAAIVDPLGWLGKCLIVGSIGLPFSKTLIISSPLARNVRKQECP